MTDRMISNMFVYVASVVVLSVCAMSYADEYSHHAGTVALAAGSLILIPGAVLVALATKYEEARSTQHRSHSCWSCD